MKPPSPQRRFPVVLACLLAATACRGEVVPVWPADLAPARKELLVRALTFLAAHPAVPYRAGGADAAGMDCSAAVAFLLGQVGIEPPRSAHGQYQWLEREGRLNRVPADARTMEAPAFAALLPGDLVFWAPDGPDPAAAPAVSHVHLFLGREADGHAVMIGASGGRGYRGRKLSGFGIVDFRVPKAGSPTRIVAFGSPFPAAPAD